MDKHEQLEAKLLQMAGLLGQLQQRLQAIEQEQANQRGWLEKLAKVSDLEWSQDVGDWVSKEKLNQLKKSPR